LQFFGCNPTNGWSERRHSTNGPSATATFTLCHTPTRNEELEQANHLPWRCATLDLGAYRVASAAAMLGVASGEGVIAQTEDFGDIAANVIVAAGWSLRQEPEKQHTKNK